MTDADSGSDDEQVTTPVENPSDSGNGGGANTNPTESKATYTITFDANGGSGAMNPQIFTYGEPQNLSPNEFTMENKDFLGWATSADGDVSYSDNAKITLTGDITLYAKWGMTATNAAETIANLTEEGTHAVTVAGEISADDLTKVAKAISGLAENVNVILDLGDTTGAEEIQYYAFKDCTNLTGFVFPASVTKIGISAFENSGIESIVIPGTVKTVGSNVFSNCSSLSTLTIEDGVETIGEKAFYNSSALKDVTVPASVKKLDTYAFHCSGLETATVYAETVGDSVFQECGSLKKVIFGNGVKTIGDTVFNLSDALEEVEIPATLESIGKDSFSGAITQFSTVKYSGTKAQWDALKDNGKISDGNEALDSATLICMGSDPKEVYTPADNAATVIAGLEGGTWENPNVYMIKITDKTLTADKLTEIGTAIKTKKNEDEWYAFIKLDISSVTGITEITEKTFYYSMLSGIILPNDLETIGIRAFVYNFFEEITIPNNVKTIENYSFSSCYYLKTITLPASLVSIGDSAFADCDRLETVNYGGTVAEWNALKDDGKISSTGNNALFNATIHCSDGDI